MHKKFYYTGTGLLTGCLLLICQIVMAQGGGTQWAKDGYQYYRLQGGNIVEDDIRDAAKSTTVVTAAMLTPQGGTALSPRRFAFSDDGNKVLLNTNTKRVWRYDTRGDYWVYNLPKR
jgi:dipeptidyl-peptidase-4